MQLRRPPEIRDYFVFRLGELNTVFAMLKVIGNYIEESWLDRIFVESGIYGENALKQILGGKHMKGSIEAHTTLYLALLRTLIFDWYNASQENKDTKCNLTKEATSEYMKEQVELVQNIFKESWTLTKIYSFGDALENQGRFFMNYMLMVENLLLFIRASREGLWMLHLSSLNDFKVFLCPWPAELCSINTFVNCWHDEIRRRWQRQVGLSERKLQCSEEWGTIYFHRFWLRTGAGE